MWRNFLLSSILCAAIIAPHAAHAGELNYEDYPIIKLRSLDKITARTMNFEAKVGSTIRFGDIFIKVQACRKPPPVEKNEAAGFLQIYQADELPTNEAKDSKFSPSSWIFSGWMFASSPALSSMDHPIYDVWVLDCLGKDPEPLPPPEEQVEAIDKAQTDSVPPQSESENSEPAPEPKPESEPAPVPTKEKDNTIYREPRPEPKSAPKPEPATEPSLDEMLQPDKAVQNAPNLNNETPMDTPVESTAPLLTTPAQNTEANAPTNAQEPITESGPETTTPQNNIDAIY